MRLIAFLTEPNSIRALLAHLGEPTTPPALAPRARDPPELDAGFAFAFDQSPSWTAPPPDPDLINHPSALLLLPLGCSALTPRYRQRRSCGREQRFSVVANPGPATSHSGNGQFRRTDYRTQATVASRARPKHAHSRPPLDRN
jgi:hypothetical protein